MPKLFPFYWLEKQIIRHVFRQADLVAAGSVKLGEYAERMGACTERIKHFRVTKNIGPQHHSPPNQRPSPDSFLADLGLPNGSRLLLTIARFHPVKLVDHAIRAMGTIVLAHPKSVLLLAGDGPERVRLENLVEQLGLNNNVRFLGLIDQNVLAQLIPHTVALAPLTGMNVRISRRGRNRCNDYRIIVTKQFRTCDAPLHTGARYQNRACAHWRRRMAWRTVHCASWSDDRRK
jgi:glycosyltransferase involved in cell wall biosynthesis